MNKKNKNKNRSKPINPIPSSQNVETVQITEDAITAVAEDTPVSLVSESDSAIEIKSDIMESVQEKDMPTETPKKPKRNKGKKKKQDEINLYDIKSSDIQALIPVSPQVAVTDEKVKDKYLEETSETIGEDVNKNVEENIAVNVRKKKNKKKTNEQEKVEVLSQMIDFDEKFDENSQKEVNVTDKTAKSDINTPEVIESEKQPKKKNKKKKHRRDSEKSDKTDEVVVCTAAFQKLISSADSEGDIIPEINKELSKNNDDEDKNLSTSVKEETLKDLIESVLLSEEIKQLDDETLQHDHINESNNKKKTKKDKKHQQQKTDTEKGNQIEEQIIQQNLSEVSVDIVQESPLFEQVEITSKDIPKVKAKIAKPVEKKRKEKAELVEDSLNKLEEEISAVEPDIKDATLEDIKMSDCICSTATLPDINDQNIKELSKFPEINENKLTVRTSQTSDKTDIIKPIIETPIVASHLSVIDVNMETKCSEQIAESSIIISDPMRLKSNTEFDNMSKEPLVSIRAFKEKNNETTSSSEPYKTVEKKKKKNVKKIDVSGRKTPDNKVLVTPESESMEATSTTSQKQKEDMFLGISSLTGVEISSLKTDDLDGSSDVTPDFIDHPLATSQQLDDNNNIIISEITSADDKTLHLMIPTEPIVQDSGETPEPVSEKIILDDLVMLSEKSVTKEPEKTDLKSKMMEVNQDMEELRLSIERSLAELTSLERSEQDIVKASCKIDDTSENRKFLHENILEKSVLQDTHDTEEISAEIKDGKTQKVEILLKVENVSEKNTDKAESVKPDKQKFDDVKEAPPQVPARKDHKGKGKSKKKGKQESQCQRTSSVPDTTTITASEHTTKEVKKEEKEPAEQKSQTSESNENKGKQQQQQTMEFGNGSNKSEQQLNDSTSNITDLSFEPIEHFEDALTSSVDDVNKTFEIIANEVNNTPELILQNPQITVISPTEDTETAESKQNPVSPPKNLLGHPNIPVPSNRIDYKKEKNKSPNMRQAKVKIKDAVDIETMKKTKQSKESQTESKRDVLNNKNVLESFSYITNENAEYIYKYSFRKVFLQSLCHVCRKKLGHRVPCQFCSLVFYCNQKHKDEDWPQHQSLCFAICTIAHLKDQKHIYADAKNITGQSYRLLRMQMIISCEKVLKRKLVPWEQEALLYPRICADVACREWQQSQLSDCEGCGQISYCSEHPDHSPASHQRWCRSYALYQKLVHHQQTRGRLEPKLPTRVLPEGYRIPEKINEVLAAMYHEKIDMTDVEYAALTQLATAPLTVAYCLQTHNGTATNQSNRILKKTSLVVHIVGAELQFEADVLFKWEVFFLHLQPHVKELRVVLVSLDLNPSNLPLDLLEKIKWYRLYDEFTRGFYKLGQKAGVSLYLRWKKYHLSRWTICLFASARGQQVLGLCESCRAENRRVLFSFQDKKTYYEYWASDQFLAPDVVCAFNPSIQRSSMYNGKDTWPAAVSCILKLKTPLIVSSYSIDELNRDVARIKECSELSAARVVTAAGPACNPFASVRPDRNFITDDEIPLLFKNYCYVVLCGV